MQPVAETLPDMGNRRATSYDVARMANVSQSSVSRAFTSGASISEDVRQRVLEVAAQLGYQPNAIARSLITRRSDLIGLMIGQATNLIYPEVLFELSRRISASGSRVLLFALESEAEIGAAMEQLWRYQVDGVISAARLSAEQVGEFATRRVPLVLYNRVLPDCAVTAVSVDHADGERRLVDRLVKAGHRRFGLISGPADNAVSVERMESALARLRQHGLDQVAAARGAYTYESGGEAFGQLVEMLAGPPDAVICANDAMAIGAVDAARHHYKLSVPQQVSIVGFDGAGTARWLSYDLTTIRQPVRRMAEAAVQMLMERIDTPDMEPETRLYAGELIQGGSARLG
ncbi:LacI family DNA-binding transcriptional regulator [Niveispirillum fermenti]|uniref:LacI family DNA-binding transcriptional regulator n=1 Tax=Niveispirillum fermenti TaxID=1233113 RepID=UPI003A86901A